MPQSILLLILLLPPAACVSSMRMAGPAVTAVADAHPHRDDVSSSDSRSLCPQSRCNCSRISNKSVQADCRNLSLTSVDNLNITSNVTKLLLSHNNLTIINNLDFDNLSSLTYLDLSSNVIQVVEGKGFESMSKLSFLNLENNDLDLSKLPTQVFLGLDHLQTLRLNNNSITSGYPDTALSNLKSLKTLVIDGIYEAEFGSGFKNLSQLSVLTLSGSVGQCNISTLKNSTFVFTPHVEYLDIALCALKIVEPEAFLPLTKLRVLNISLNSYLSFRQLANLHMFPKTFTILKANRIEHKYKSCVKVKKTHIQFLANTSLTDLYLDDNEIESIEVGVLPLLPKTLTFISARRNKFSRGEYMREFSSLTGLQVVDLSGKSFPITVPDYDSCSAPGCDEEAEEPEEYDFVSSWTQSRSQWPRHPMDVTNLFDELNNFNLSLPPNLTVIRSNFTQMTFNIGETLFQKNKITHLDLSSNLVQFQDGQLQGLNSVSYIDLSNNLAREMSKSLFRDCQGLVTLNISFNFFGWQIQNDTRGDFFQFLTNLKHLIIANNDMKQLTGKVISNLTSLEVLNISNNGLFDFSPDVSKLTKLKTIDASNNQVKWLKPHTIRALSAIKNQSRTLTFILRGNPLSCSCESVDSLTWLLNSGVTPDNMTGYYCLLPDTKKYIFDNKTAFKEIIDKISADCKNNFGLALGCVSIFIAAIALMVGAVLYRYRWKLRYLYYAARLRYFADKEPEDDDEDMSFDAFVSYADEDRSFVINNMRAHLEHESSMRLNIHHRDFMPGEPIISNIVAAIKKSRKTLILLSPNFLKSYWCRYELHMAQMESISTGRDIIIVIMYESVPVKDIPPEFLHLLQSDSYIEYSHEECNETTFWRHLSQAIRHRTHRLSSQSSQVNA